MQAKAKNLINYSVFEDNSLLRKMQILKQIKQSKENQETGKIRYKTEICRSFKDNSICRYGQKCQFAHGDHELRNLNRHEKFKTELCRRFHQDSYCPYGPRCHFIHEPVELKPHAKKQLILDNKSNKIPSSKLNTSLFSSNEILNFTANGPQLSFSPDTTTSSFGNISGTSNQDFFQDANIIASTPKSKPKLSRFELTPRINTSSQVKTQDYFIQDSSENSTNSFSLFATNNDSSYNFSLNSSASISPSAKTFDINNRQNNDLALDTDDLSSRLDYIMKAAFFKNRFYQ